MDQINETGTNNTDKSKNMDKIHESGKKYTFEDLREIMRTLRSENGCPWDRRQTHESLIPCLEEEAGEAGKLCAEHAGYRLVAEDNEKLAK